MRFLAGVFQKTRAERFPLAFFAFSLIAQILDTVTTYNLFIFNTARAASNHENNPALAATLQTPLPAVLKLIFVPLITYLAVSLLCRKFANSSLFSPLLIAFVAITGAIGYTVAIAICNAQLPH